MAAYFHSPNNQREPTPTIYTRDSWLSSNPEPSPFIPPRVMGHTNYLSSANTNELPPRHLEILSNLSGPQDEFSVWGAGGNGMPFMPLLGSATSLLEGMQNFQGRGQSQGLSLSLSTPIQPTVQVPPIEYRNPNPSDFSSFTGNNNPSNPIREDENSPNYGVPSVGGMVPNSKYLKAAQELLDEMVNVRKELKEKGSKEVAKSGEGAEGESRRENMFPPASEVSQDLSSSSPSELSATEKQDLQNKLSKLLIMLEEVDQRYKQYYHQMQIIVSSFDVISGPGSANPYTSLALQTISRHFRTLRDAITNQIKSVQKSLGEKDSSHNRKGVGISRLRFVDQHLKQQRALQQMGMMQQQWRPQRGLPDRSVSILRGWLFEHFLHPYPKDSEKLMLARQTGLTRNQVSNWFINARVRLWKPMVEEMYKEEAGDVEIGSTSSPETGNKSSKLDTKGSNDIDNQEIQPNTSSTEQNKNNQFREFKHDPISNMEMTGTTNPTLKGGELRPCLDDGSHFQGYQVPGFGRIGDSNSVSLTLGLQHRDGRSLPISVANQNFAIYNTESSSLGHHTADFEMDSENKQHGYGSSHLLRDFVA